MVFPLEGVLKFIVDMASRAIPIPAIIRVVFQNSKGELLFMFLEHVGVKESNGTKVTAILETVWIFSAMFQGK